MFIRCYGFWLTISKGHIPTRSALNQLSLTGRSVVPVTMIVMLWLVALVQIGLGAGVLVSDGSSIHEVLGTNLIGFGILTIGFAGLQSELQKGRLEAAQDRRQAKDEQQALAAKELK